MIGAFSTNRTKEFHSLTGSIEVKRKNDFYKQSALIAHLEELGLAKNLSFIQEEEKLVALLTIQNTKIDTEKKEVKIENATTTINNKQQIVITTPSIKSTILLAADVLNRKIETIQSVYYKSDSLEITLYDNGEVDGDE